MSNIGGVENTDNENGNEIVASTEKMIENITE
jgi:hypothetical protein